LLPNALDLGVPIKNIFYNLDGKIVSEAVTCKKYFKISIKVMILFTKQHLILLKIS